MRRRLRSALATLGLLLAAFFFLVYRQVLTVVEKPSWPPDAGAITAQAPRLRPRASPRAPTRSRRTWECRMRGRQRRRSTRGRKETYFFPRIFADIEQARSSVHILMFGWREGDVGTKLTDLLEQKLKQGVQVRVIVDAAGSKPFGPAEPMFRRLADAGAQIVVNDTFPWDRDGLYPDGRSFDRNQDEVGRADHRKLYVIDGDRRVDGRRGHRGPLRERRLPRRDGARHRRRRPAGAGAVPDELPRPRRAPSGRPLEALSHAATPRRDPDRAPPDPPGGFVSATQAMRDLIDHAQTRLDVMNPYLTDADMIQRITAAARRGVDVRVVVSENSNNTQATAALEHHYRELLDAGAKIWEYPGAVVHAKLLVADDTIVFGTVNLDAWALYRNYEIAMTARSPAAARLLEERVFTPDIARSKPGTAPNGLRARLNGWVWDKLSYFL